MPSTPDFRRKPSAPSAPSASALVKASDGPLPQGRLFLSDHTKQQLGLLGWKEGDPLPEGFAAKVADAQKLFQEDLAAAKVNAPPGTPVTRPQKIVNIADLSPEKQAELAALLQEVRQEGPAMPPEEVPNFAPPLTQEAQFPVGIVDDRQEVEAKSETTQPPMTNCPRCKHDLSQPFDIELTPRDIQAYVVHIEGPARFIKDYDVLPSRLSVTFRTLTPSELQMIRLQLIYDMERGEIGNEAEYYMQAATYQLSLGLMRITKASGVVTAELPPVDQIPYDPPEGGKETPLVPLFKHIATEVLNHESLFRLVGQRHQQFQRLIGLLEEHTKDPDFYREIA